ncbi:YfgM family protein [Succinatimonas hippei]|uniref:Ancillary SecYEG translocon subunit n=1 Tax=Succinatimonas hippei (strain DSM 22608 / JCM 16073 / KCTC 15190 / YIT 12066) TaxID=762983 RepID=E8LK49_SUCHY|nr:tetratricopeptide repeat protein [Succinatimonas hippei]EFY07165.1 tetratricopeptide repeat protein [Succinatimonas hippei YIT 12066]MCL1603220.1 tetratricopeptide repeat protein [Succinatimonas hippei]MDM8119802.1 tetratricopeptide repeat protein [Succinatimonas hippei]
MDVLTDDHEREEVVKKWWHEYWKPIALGVVIALGGLIGFRQYQSYELNKSQEQALAVYQLQEQLNEKGLDVIADAQKFIAENDNIYGALVALDVATLQMTEDKFTDAAATLEQATAKGGDLLKPAITLTLARLQAQNQEYDKAVSTANSVNSDAYALEKFEVLGDIYMASGDRQKAHDAYKNAIELCKSKKLPINGILQMKFDNLIAAGDTPAFREMSALQQQ